MKTKKKRKSTTKTFKLAGGKIVTVRRNPKRTAEEFAKARDLSRMHG